MVKLGKQPKCPRGKLADKLKGIYTHNGVIHN